MTGDEDKAIREVLRDVALDQQTLTDRMDAADRDRAATLRMVAEMHNALMQPQPGHTASLLERMAQVTIAAETGKAAGERVIWWAKVFAAVGAIVSGFYAAVKFGHPPK